MTQQSNIIITVTSPDQDTSSTNNEEEVEHEPEDLDNLSEANEHVNDNPDPNQVETVSQHSIGTFTRSASITSSEFSSFASRFYYGANFDQSEYRSNKEAKFEEAVLFGLKLSWGAMFMLMGAYYIDACPKEPMIPIFLIGNRRQTVTNYYPQHDNFLF